MHVQQANKQIPQSHKNKKAKFERWLTVTYVTMYITVLLQCRYVDTYIP